MASFWQKTKRNTDDPKSRKSSIGAVGVVPEVITASEAVATQEGLVMEPMAIREANVVAEPASNLESDFVRERVLTHPQLQSDTGTPVEPVKNVAEDMEIGEKEAAAPKASSRRHRRAVAIEEHMDVEVDGVGVIGVGDDV